MIKENVFVLVGRAEYKDSYRAVHISAFDVNHKHMDEIKKLIDENHEMKEILSKYSDEEIFTGEMAFMLECDPYIIEVGRLTELHPQDYINMYDQAIDMEIEYAEEEAERLGLSEIEKEHFVSLVVGVFKKMVLY